MNQRLHPYFAFLLGILLLSFALPTQAQDENATRRDPRDLAQRLLGFDAEYALPMPSPVYEAGETAEFWVPKITSAAPTKITAEVAAVTPNIYVWVEEGLEYDPAQMQQMSADLDTTVQILRYRDNYGPRAVLPGVGEVPDLTSQMPMPDIDADPRLFIIYTSELGDTPVVYNFNDSLPVEFAPGGYSNQHETFLLNSSFYAGTPLTDGVYINLLTRYFYAMLMDYNYPDQALWLKNAMGWFVAEQLAVSAGLQESMTSYLQTPNTNFTAQPTLTNNAQVIGGQALLLSYFVQRYGAEPFRELFIESGEGLQPLENALVKYDVRDIITDQSVTGLDVFADFVITNVVNVPFGDGRFVHTLIEFPQGTSAAAQAITNPSNFGLDDQTLEQFGTLYLTLENQTEATYSLNFDGMDNASRLPMPDGSDPGNFFYWSGDGRDQNTTLTRAIDLRDTASATLTFDAWYSLADEWNYAYIEVSTDNGATWEILPATSSTQDNRFGAAYGAGFTGISNSQEARPFPTLGVLLDNDGATAVDVVPDGPSAQAGVQPGDVIIGYDETPWPGGRPDIFGLLSQRSAGDTLNLYIQRGAEQLTIPVTLGAHPERIINPEPLWLSQEVDLSAYSGQEILLRFEYISLAGRDNPGIAIDNIAIPEIDYRDTADSDGNWETRGWMRINNQIPQRYLVQIVRSGTETTPPSVRQLIGVGDEATDGTWQIAMEAQELMIIAISPVTHETQQPAQFDFTITSGDSLNTF
jgi:hypothetical protein